MGLNHFDAVFYINLDHREDRKVSILLQLEKLEIEKEKIIRIPAVLDSLNGQRGCALSHIKALDLAIEKKLNNVLILEDDCEFVQSKSSIRQMIKYFFDNVEDWDVFLLGGNVLKSQKTKHKMIKRVLKSVLAHAYLVNRHYFRTLKKCFEESYKLLQKDVFFSQRYDLAIDRYWFKLQMKDKWYILETLIAKQLRSFSDIENIERDRRVLIN